MGDLTDKELKNLKPRAKLYKVTDRDGMHAAVTPTGDDRAVIFGAMIWIAEKLNSQDGEHARDTWAKLGKMAFEMERPAGAYDRTQPPQDRA